MERKTKQAAGYDLRAENGGSLLPGRRCQIPLRIKGSQIIWPGVDVFGQLEMRSSLANKYGLMVLAGIIDSDFKDQIILICLNTGDNVFEWAANDRVCQILFKPYLTFGEEPTDVRLGGFGSTDSEATNV